MKKRFLAASAATAVFLAMAGSAAASVVPLSVSCAGTAHTSGVTWSATVTGGVAPAAFLWGNGATTSPVTVSYSAGTYQMTIQATDASSTTATSSCSATVVAAPVAPIIASFTAAPSSVMVGNMSVLAWTVTNASSTNLDQGIGAVSSTSVTVWPTVTTTYTLTATNPTGSTVAQTTITVGTTTPSSGSIADQIKALLAQIVALQSQIAELISSQSGNSGTGSIPPGQVGNTACVELSRNLGFGDRGDDVEKLQEMLISDPSTGYTASTTGYFGPMTEHALIRFQISHGIVSSESETDGSAGSLTRGFFHRSCGEGLMKKSDTSTGESSSSESATSYTGSTTTLTLPNENNNGQGGNSNQGNGNNGEHGNSHEN